MNRVPTEFRKLSLLFAAVLVVAACTKPALQISIHIEGDAPQIRHGITKLRALETSGLTPDDDFSNLLLNGRIDSTLLSPEAFRINRNSNQVDIVAGDPTGMMYALLDIKEQLELYGKVSSKEEAPNLAFRALKFNLPWDSYRNGEALQLHTETCLDTNYWHSFLDMMAENRFNKLTLWNLHPFSYMVKTEKYPEAGSLSDEELREWQLFWHTLFRMAKDRGIETYLVNWNIFVSEEFARAHGVSPISLQNDFKGDGDTSELVRNYTRECVRATIDTYPNLTGLGITLGEGMTGMIPEERNQWLLDSFIQGVREASRKIKFIYRAPLSAGTSHGGSTSATVEKMTRATLDTLSCFDGPINIELKFNWSHGHSSTKLVKVHGGELTDVYWNPLPKNYYLAWMIRNEDFFVLRWGQADFIREHIEMNVHPYVNGYYVGSETYIPAKDYITSLEGASTTYAFERQWMFYKMWGRLLYNSQTPDALFQDAFESRFPGKGAQLFQAQRRASKVPLVIASFVNGWWDYTLHSESFTGFNVDEAPSVKLISLKTLAERPPLEPDYISVADYVADTAACPDRISPVQLADSVELFCKKALRDVAAIDPGDDVDLLYEVSDIKAWAYLGLYFSNKLRAAVEYKAYRVHGDESNIRRAVRLLETATEQWSELVKTTQAVYDPVPMMGVDYNTDLKVFHWSMYEKQVQDELIWLKSLHTFVDSGSVTD